MEEIRQFTAALESTLNRALGPAEGDALLGRIKAQTAALDEAEMANLEGWQRLALFQARLLFAFFQELTALLETRHGLVCVNERINPRFVVSEDFCRQWVEGALLAKRGRKQQFGSFFDFGEPRYCLHVEVGSTNLHLGLVKVWRQAERISIIPMGEFDLARIEVGLNRRLPEAWRLRQRDWGHRWCSIDCGSFQAWDTPRVAQALLDVANSPLLTEVLPHLTTALAHPAFQRTWAMQAFDRRQWFRLFIDGRLQRGYAGWRGYENNEPGSVQGMLNAFAYLLDHLHRSADLDVPYLLELHRQCMQGVRSKNRKSTPGEVRFREAGFLFYAKNSTLSSLAEVFALRRGDGSPVFHDEGCARSTDAMDFLEAHAAIQSRGHLRFRPWYPSLSGAERELIAAQDESPAFLALKATIQAGYLERMEALLNDYQARIAGARHETDILQAIARLARDLELLHPFPDGNGRVFPVALACQLLLYHGYPPVIFRDPNIDAELSYAEFTAEMVQAMRNTLALIDNPEASLFDYAMAESSQAEVDDFAFMARELSAKVDLLSRGPDAEELFATPSYLAWVTGGRWVKYQPDLRFAGAGSHRTYDKGFLYFALAAAQWEKEGKSIDAELRRVLARGVTALVLDRPVTPEQYPVPVLVVDDLEAALKQAAHRTRLDAGCQTVLITGTEGKTGAKVQLHHLLSRQTATHAVLNSANTEGPVLFSLLNIRPATRVELNEVSVGALEALRVERARLVSPDICLFTNIGPNHMDMHKTIDNVILAKSSVVEGLPPGGLAIVNAHNEYAGRLMASIRQRRPDVIILTYGETEQDTGRLLRARFVAARLGWEVEAKIGTQPVEFFVPLLPNHAPLASIGVLLTVHQLGYDVLQAARDYADFRPYATMGQVLRLHLAGGDVLFYDQSRRGGLHGMRAAFQDLAQLSVPGRVVALVGGISVRKDGDWTRQAHQELAALINGSRIDRLYTTGAFMQYVHSALTHPEILRHHHADHDDITFLGEQLLAELRPEDLLFIIGSAYLYLGRVSDFLLKRLPHSPVNVERETARS